MEDEKYDLSARAYVLVLCHDQSTIVDNVNEGRGADLEKVKDFFDDYRTNKPLDVNHNLKYREVIQLMESVESKDFSQYSCLVVVIMGTGDKNNTIIAEDGQPYSLRTDIVEKLTANRTLVGKPKIFIVNASQKNFAETTYGNQETIIRKIDTIMFQSAYEKPLARGKSIFVFTFFRELRKNDRMNVDDINMKLNKHATGQGYFAKMTSTLRKRFLFYDLRCF